MTDRKATLDAIMRAMELEKETFDFYTKAAHKTFNPDGKRIFHWLAKTEEQHYLKLSELYSSLDQNERWVFYGGSTISLEPETDECRKVTYDTNDLTALEIAMAIEQKGSSFYEELLPETTDPDGRAMLETLISEEAEHLRVVQEKYAAVKGKK
jgi:rubrerythrin